MSEENRYIPRFERDLQSAGGDISVLAEKKSAERDSLEGISGGTDVSSLRNAPEEKTAPEAEIEVEDEPAYAPEETLPDIDFVYGDEDGTGSGGGPVIPSAESIALDDLNEIKTEEMRTAKNAASDSLRAMMIADDLAMEMGGVKTDEMSEEYGSSRRRQDDITEKDVLDRDEKEALKSRLQAEIGAKPEGFNQRKSNEMYKRLLEEQRAKAALKGFGVLAAMAVMALCSAALGYFLKLGAIADLPYAEYLQYLPFGAAFFSLFMLIRSKFCRAVSVLYFVLYTTALITGLLFYAMSPDNQALDGDYIIKLTLFVIAIIFGAAVSFKVASSNSIGAYYSYTPPKKKR